MTKWIRKQYAESFVFDKEEQQRLRYRPVVKASVQIRSRMDASHPDTIKFVEGKDFVVNDEEGWIRRTKESRIPDWSQHVLYGKKDFDHTLFGDYSNRDFTVYADYEYEQDEDADETGGGGDLEYDALASVKEKLQKGQVVTFVVYGDSISAGGEASEERYTYYRRFSDHLADLYPNGNIRVVNCAIGGETSEGGAGRVEHDVVPHLPDLVTIAYGMNDQNKFNNGNAISLYDYMTNIRFMIETIRRRGDVSIILVTPCQPNPLWTYTSGQIGEYAEALRQLGREYGIGVADVYAVWQRELDEGKTPESLLLNNINHPNDYGHYLYYKAFEPILLGKRRS
ncbi:SGNH/GDSL hydrolase family protein [Paenibacillus sp. GCM10027628]|uniref:SGNH/GDSL hydrolase family protein n=1 Tax=Paenibacillus sp. GCM10027628 TaxID=3273413 RepID=UPI00363E6BFB